jgi:hypothetical protein
VITGRCRHIDGVDLRVAYEFFHVRGPERHLVALRKVTRLIPGASHDRHQLTALHAFKSWPTLSFNHVAAADDSPSHAIVHTVPPLLQRLTGFIGTFFSV